MGVQTSPLRGQMGRALFEVNGTTFCGGATRRRRVALRPRTRRHRVAQKVTDTQVRHDLVPLDATEGHLGRTLDVTEWYGRGVRSLVVLEREGVAVGEG